MDDKNQFLNSYKKKLEAQQEEQIPEQSPAGPAAEANPGTPPPVLHYEEKSDFVRLQTGANAGLGSRRKSPGLPMIIWILLTVTPLVAIGLFWFFSQGVQVENLMNWAVTDAQLWARENEIQLQVEEQYNDQYDEGKVISQSVAAGTRVRKGSFIPILVSLGHDLTVELELPDLMNMTKTEIDTWSAANFMTKVRITTEFSATVATGKVIRFEINDNTVVDKVKRNTPVYVIVSKGPEEQVVVKVTLPNFKEKSVAQSYEFANENGLSLKVVEAYDDYAPSGQIIAQSVKAEEEVDKGTEITLTVSQGKKIVLPDFSGYTKAKASAIAAGLGITVATTEKYSAQPAGAFLSQSLAADSVYISGDVLELAYSLGNQTVLASFVGQSRAAIENWAKELNDQGAAIAIKVTYTQSNSPKDVILYQSKANTAISTTTDIYITISRGKAVFVPDFVAPEGSGYDTAMTREKALAVCGELNLVPIFVAESKAGRLPGEIWYQSVAAGKEVYEGSTVTLKFAPANVTLAVPNFTGMTRQAVIDGEWLKHLAITFVTSDVYKDGYAGQVYKQSIPANTTVASGAAITLSIYPSAAVD